MSNCPVGFSYRVAMPRFPNLIRNSASAVLPLSGGPPHAAAVHDKQFFVVSRPTTSRTGHFPSRQPRSNQLTYNLLWPRLS